MPHVLVVDDNEMVLSLLTRILETAGYAVSAARGGTQALEALEKLSPNAILSDIDMPDINGYRLLREVRARYPHLPFLAMSGRPVVLDEAAGEFDAVLSKPFRMRELLEALEQATAPVQCALGRQARSAQDIRRGVPAGRP